MSIILALDATTKVCGWVLGDGAMMIDTSVEVFKDKDPHTRIKVFGLWLSATIYHQKGIGRMIDIIAYEKPTGSHGNPHTDRLLGAVWHQAWDVADDWGLRFLEIYPSQVKATGVHKGDLDGGEQFLAACGFQLSTTKPGDQLDGCGVWLAALKKLREES